MSSDCCYSFSSFGNLTDLQNTYTNFVFSIQKLFIERAISARAIALYKSCKRSSNICSPTGVVWVGRIDLNRKNMKNILETAIFLQALAQNHRQNANLGPRLIGFNNFQFFHTKEFFMFAFNF